MVALSRSSRIDPRGRSGMMPKVEPHALHRRRALPSRSFPHAMVRPPQVWQAGAVEVGMEASIAFSIVRLYGQITDNVKRVDA